MSNNFILDISDLWFRYEEDWILKEINLQIIEKKVLGIIGPNGGGKTTLLKLIIGLETPDKGEILLKGSPLKNKKNRLRIGYVPQHATVRWTFPIKVKDVILLGVVNEHGKLTRAGKTDLKNLHDITSSLQIEHLLNKHISELSGGEQQKVFISRALINNPELLLLDEPQTGIDVAAQDLFFKTLSEIHKKFNLTIIIVTHDLNVVPKICDEVACVNQSLFHHSSPAEAITCPNFDKHFGSHLEVLVHGSNVPHRLVHDHEKEKE